MKEVKSSDHRERMPTSLQEAERNFKQKLLSQKDELAKLDSIIHGLKAKLSKDTAASVIKKIDDFELEMRAMPKI